MAERYTAEPLAIDNADSANVVELPNLVTGRLADLIASATVPGERHELRGEEAIREAFRSEVESAPRVQRQWWRRPAIVAAASAASIMIASTSLAAATGVPAPVAHIVDRVLGHAGNTGTGINPTGTPDTGGTSGTSVVPVVPGVESAGAGSVAGPQNKNLVTCSGKGHSVKSGSCDRNPGSGSQKAGQGATAATGATRKGTQGTHRGTRQPGTDTGTGTGTAAGMHRDRDHRGGNRGTGTGTGRTGAEPGAPGPDGTDGEEPGHRVRNWDRDRDQPGRKPGRRDARDRENGAETGAPGPARDRDEPWRKPGHRDPNGDPPRWKDATLELAVPLRSAPYARHRGSDPPDSESVGLANVWSQQPVDSGTSLEVPGLVTLVAGLLLVGDECYSVLSSRGNIEALQRISVTMEPAAPIPVGTSSETTGTGHTDIVELGRYAVTGRRCRTLQVAGPNLSARVLRTRINRPHSGSASMVTRRRIRRLNRLALTQIVRRAPGRTLAAELLRLVPVVSASRGGAQLVFVLGEARETRSAQAFRSQVRHTRCRFLTVRDGTFRQLSACRQLLRTHPPNGSLRHPHHAPSSGANNDHLQISVRFPSVTPRPTDGRSPHLGSATTK